MAMNIQMNMNIHAILNGVEYLNKYLIEYSFKFWLFF